MRLALAAVAFLVAGCGSVVPYSLAPGWLAPDVVPDETASAVIVTDTSEGAAALSGRVVDGRSGTPLPGARVELADGTVTTTGADGRFVLDLPPGLARVRVELAGYVPAAEAVEVAGRTSVLVILDPEPTGDDT